MWKTRIDEEDETEDNSEDEEKRDSFKDNNEVDYNDDGYEDIGTVRKMKIGQDDEENVD